ncbi:hypothetical protein J31TS6_40250 [Brevibacillus reuszeri]|uniref:hypothetical protein n=1 Tax=Brevibacillus reuszeri TaxID=54915 RepID=UPI001B2DEBA5|nr:hypothetical protein [Brevibacillus reuszeri]GIO07997.1 hypothetical protein J31TS6_40250 [Brevibacillus reuszeri]
MLPEDLNDLFTKDQLYTSHQFERKDIDSLYCHLIYERKFDCYCIECGKESTFVASKIEVEAIYDDNKKLKFLNDMVAFGKAAKCSRDEKHQIIFLFQIQGYRITKIGQSPSTADISGAGLKQYHKLLGKDQYREFNKAVGLASHGVGIGSFVYLRRIFENLLEEAHLEAKEEQGWNEEEYLKARVHEKISILSGRLPSFLVETKGMYSVLSKGIHELSESECNEVFPVLKLGIELILDEKILEKEKQEKIKSVTDSISDFVHKFKKNV